MAENNGIEEAKRDDAAIKGNYMQYFKAALEGIEGVHRKAIAEWLGSFATFDAMVDGVKTRLQGTWKESVGLMASAVTGLFAGHAIGRRLPAGDLPFPMISLLGLVGVIPGLWMKQPWPIRNALTLGGTLFAAGAYLGSKSVGE